jgi:hypothetical protein
MTYSKELLDWMTRRRQRHIDLQIYRALDSSPFNGAKLPPLGPAISTRDYMPYPYEREPHRCGPSCSRRFSILDCAV